MNIFFVHSKDATLLHVLHAVAEEAEIAGAGQLLVGATARDILLNHVFDVPAGRASYDVDFAVAVAGWDQFERLKIGLASRPGFTTSDASQQRIRYKDTTTDLGYPIDLLVCLSRRRNPVSGMPSRTVDQTRGRRREGVSLLAMTIPIQQVRPLRARGSHASQFISVR